jgi:hypothetical protein
VGENPQNKNLAKGGMNGKETSYSRDVALSLQMLLAGRLGILEIDCSEEPGRRLLSFSYNG